MRYATGETAEGDWQEGALVEDAPAVTPTEPAGN